MQSETSPNFNLGNLVGNSMVGICLTLPNLGFLWVFFKYPKISKNGNPLFFPVFEILVITSNNSKPTCCKIFKEKEEAANTPVIRKTYMYIEHVVLVGTMRNFHTNLIKMSNC